MSIDMLETTVRIKPIDRDGPSIVIFKEANSGKVAIGRGEFLRCANKKVSRIHAELQLDVGGQVHFTPLHANPCYYFRGGEVQNRVEVRKGEEKTLEDGDHFSLLPDAYVYKVVIEKVYSCGLDAESHDGEPKALNKVTVEPEVDLQVNGNSTNNLQGFNETTTGAQQSNSNNIVENANSLPENGNGARKRTLPAWLLEAADEPLETSKSSSVKSKKTASPSTVAARKKTVKPKPSTSKRRDFSESSSDEDDDRETVDKMSTIKPEPSTKGKGNGEAKCDEKVSKKRAICKFGDECYRKNPEHFKEYAHPQDPDYVKEADSRVSSDDDVDDDDDRPQCEYGYDCYRKNPQHRAEYKHILRPTTKRKAAKEAKKKASKNDKDDDSDDSYDESFIDDDSDEYVPSKDDANYSGDEEDLKRMNKEAQLFIKNQKLHQIPK